VNKMEKSIFLWVLAGGLSLSGGVAPVLAQSPQPPGDVRAVDFPNDAGEAVRVDWDLSPDDQPQPAQRLVVAYEILRREAGEEAFTRIGEETYQTRSFKDDGCTRGASYFYQVVALGPDGARSAAATTTDAVTPVMQYFDLSQFWFGVILLIVGGSVIFYIQLARSGRELKVRRIAGLEAVDEAVGRATEMGRPCLYVPGILDINDMQTIAGVTVLSRVAGLTAEFDARLDVPTSRSLVMTACRETVEAAYLGAGRPDAYNEDSVYYLTDEQFGYVAGVTGKMLRERPAACFYMGAFFAESLILAETGNAVGAIQVAGTAMPSQLPFFVAACDYTLIGEELFAASAYLSGESHQLGSLKGQDVGKVLGGTLVVVGCLLSTVAVLTDASFLSQILTYLTDHVLGNRGW